MLAHLPTFTRAQVLEFLRYWIASIIAFGVDISLLWYLTSIQGWHYLASAAVSFACGLITIYLLSVWWVFEHHTLASRTRELTVFALIGLVGLGMNELLLWALTDGFDVHYLVSRVGSTFIIFFWNYIARKKLLF